MNSPLSDSEIISAFRSKGFKATSQRIAICRSVLSSREHPTAQRIYEDVKKVHPTVSLATVYKTLRVLGELNIVQELSLKQGDTRFDPYVDPHLNLICEKCGNIRDVDNEQLRDVIQKVTKQTKFSLSGQHFVLYGLCERCSSEQMHRT
jgi:Fur family peroxide stress response transcriptional regulator